jgi:hypothetical protein
VGALAGRRVADAADARAGVADHRVGRAITHRFGRHLPAEQAFVEALGLGRIGRDMFEPDEFSGQVAHRGVSSEVGLESVQSFNIGEEARAEQGDYLASTVVPFGSAGFG